MLIGNKSSGWWKGGRADCGAGVEYGRERWGGVEVLAWRR